MLKNLKLEDDPQVIKPNFSTLNHHLNKLHNVIVKYDKKSKNKAESITEENLVKSHENVVPR